MKLHCNYCSHDQEISKIKLFIKLYLQNKVYYTCPKCGKISCYRIIYHIIHDTIDIREKEINKRLTESLKELWKK